MIKLEEKFNNLYNRLEEKFIYRGESETTYSKLHEAPAGIFFAISEKDASGFGKVTKYIIDKKAKLFEYYSSDHFVSDNNLEGKEYPELKKYYNVNSLDEYLKTRKTFNKEFYLNLLFIEQLIAKIELEKAGYDGVYWNGREDDGLFKQYQIWNLSIIKAVDKD